MGRHDESKALWQHGQVWQTKLEECTQWVMVGHDGLAQPLWDERQDYRRRPDLEHQEVDDREARRLWIEAGMPPYLLSKPGTNHGLVRFLELARAKSEAHPTGHRIGGPEATLDQVMEAVAEMHADRQQGEQV